MWMGYVLSRTREEEREEMRLREELKAVETALRKIKKVCVFV